MSDRQVPALSKDAVLKASAPVPKGVTEVKGIDFDDYDGRDVTVVELVREMANTGFQATAVAEAVQIINDMVSFQKIFCHASY